MNSKFDFSELNKLHQETFNSVIQVVVDHYDTWVKDENVKVKALTQIKKDTEKFKNLFGGTNGND